MHHSASFLRTWLRQVALVAVTVFGLVAIVGSGGGGDAANCSFFSDVCNPVVGGPTPATPAASISPIKLTVQAGASAVFTAQASGIDQPRFQWRRSADGGVTFIDIPGATAATYTLANVQFADDDATSV